MSTERPKTKLKPSPSEWPQVWQVDPETVGRRLDVFLAGRIEAWPRAKVRRALAAGLVLIDEQICQKAGRILRVGENVVLTGEPTVVTSSNLTPTPMGLNVLFEDEHLLVVDKPAGIAMHPGAGTRGPTLVEGVLHYLSTRGEALSRRAESLGRDEKAHLRPGLVHRLDKDTTGAVVIAKTDEAHVALSEQFRHKTNLREYLVLVDGLLPGPDIEHESWLGRDARDPRRFASYQEGSDTGPPRRWAKSRFVTAMVFGERLSLCRVSLVTGRTHQIRVHATDLSQGVVGDRSYIRAKPWPSYFPDDLKRQLDGVGRQLLHARLLGFEHPASGEKLCFESPVPQDFQELLNILIRFEKSRRI